jgi:hypothetical protein
MASRIPTPALRGQEVGSVQSQFTPTPFQNLSPDADVFGAGQARMLQQASAGLSAAADGLIKQAKEDDNSALLATQNGSMAFTQNMVNNPVDGLLTRQKGNSVGVAKEGLDTYASWKASVPQASTASGRAAQAAYFGQQEAQLYQTLSGHERTQRVEVRKEEYGTLIANSMQAMATNYLNPQALADNEALIRATTIRLADTSGSSKEAAAEAAEKAVSDAYSGVLYRMIGNKDSEQARALHTELLRAGKLQPSKENTALATALDKVEADAAGMKLGFEAQDKHPDDPANAARWIAGQPVSQEVKAAALTSMDQQNARVIRAESQQLSRIAEEQGLIASKGGDLNGAALARLSPTTQAAIIALRDRARNPDQNTDKPAFSAYMRLTPTQRGNMTEEDYVAKFYSKFSNADQIKADGLYSNGKVSAGVAEGIILRGAATQQDADQKESLSLFEKQLADISAGLKFGPSTADRAKLGAWEAAMRSSFVIDNGVVAQTPQQIDTLLNNGLRKFGDTYVGALEVTSPLPEGSMPGNLARIPRNLRTDAAISYARSHNLPAGEEVDIKKLEAWMDQQFFVPLSAPIPAAFVDGLNTVIRAKRRSSGMPDIIVGGPISEEERRSAWEEFSIKRFVSGVNKPFEEKEKPPPEQVGKR